MTEQGPVRPRSDVAVRRRTALALRVKRRPAVRRGGPWLILAGAAVPAIVMVAYGLGEGRVALAVVAAGGCICCVATYLAAGRLAPRYYAPRLLTISYGTQLLALFAISALGLPLSPPYHP